MFLEEEYILQDPDMRYGPDDLWWKRKNLKTTKSSIKLETEQGVIYTYSDSPKPTEEVLSVFFKNAKECSLDNKEARIVQYRESKRKGQQTFVIAFYRNGELQTYCRPVWRNAVFE